MKWEEGRLKKEKADRKPLLLPSSTFFIYPGLVYSFINEELALKKKKTISPPSFEQEQLGNLPN